MIKVVVITVVITTATAVVCYCVGHFSPQRCMRTFLSMSCGRGARSCVGRANVSRGRTGRVFRSGLSCAVRGFPRRMVASRVTKRCERLFTSLTGGASCAMKRTAERRGKACRIILAIGPVALLGSACTRFRRGTRRCTAGISGSIVGKRTVPRRVRVRARVCRVCCRILDRTTGGKLGCKGPGGVILRMRGSGRKGCKVEGTSVRGLSRLLVRSIRRRRYRRGNWAERARGEIRRLREGARRGVVQGGRLEEGVGRGLSFAARGCEGRTSEGVARDVLGLRRCRDTNYIFYCMDAKGRVSAFSMLRSVLRSKGHLKIPGYVRGKVVGMCRVRSLRRLRPNTCKVLRPGRSPRELVRPKRVSFTLVPYVDYSEDKEHLNRKNKCCSECLRGAHYIGTLLYERRLLMSRVPIRRRSLQVSLIVSRGNYCGVWVMETSLAHVDRVYP